MPGPIPPITGRIRCFFQDPERARFIEDLKGTGGGGDGEGRKICDLA